MKSPKLISTTFFTFILQALLLLLPPASVATTTHHPLPPPAVQNSSVFREYIGAMFENITFSDVPIKAGVEFHFILSFAIDYTTNLSQPRPTNGKFNIFWDADNLTPRRASTITKNNPNVRIAISIGGDSVGPEPAYFNPSTKESWVSNAAASLTAIVKKYNASGIDIDYEHFKADPDTFAECIGKLVATLKQSGAISFASIAPFADPEVQAHYLTLWKKYGHLIDYVNFQFYAYDNSTTVEQFLSYFDEQSKSYAGGRVLTSFISDGSHGLGPGKGFFKACKKMKKEGKLHGIFVWCADDSKKFRFKYEKKSQALLASS